MDNDTKLDKLADKLEALTQTVKHAFTEAHRKVPGDPYDVDANMTDSLSRIADSLDRIADSLDSFPK